MGTTQEDQYTFFVISRSVFLGMRNVSAYSCRETQNTHIIFNNFFFQNRAVYETIQKNAAEASRPHTTIRCMRTARSIPKLTNTHSEFVIFIDFTLKQWLHESASMLRFKVHNLACLIYFLQNYDRHRNRKLRRVRCIRCRSTMHEPFNII
jgi:hypothetical protein